MKAAYNLHDEDLLWLLRERQTQRSDESNSGQDQNGDAAGDVSAEDVEPNETLNSEENAKPCPALGISKPCTEQNDNAATLFGNYFH